MALNGISTLPTKQQRQIAKLILAQQKRAGQDRYQGRDNYELWRLPAPYVGNTPVTTQFGDTPYPTRPWINSNNSGSDAYSFAFSNDFGRV